MSSCTRQQKCVRERKLSTRVHSIHIVHTWINTRTHARNHSFTVTHTDTQTHERTVLYFMGEMIEWLDIFCFIVSSRADTYMHEHAHTRVDKQSDPTHNTATPSHKHLQVLSANIRTCIKSPPFPPQNIHPGYFSRICPLRSQQTSVTRTHTHALIIIMWFIYLYNYLHEGA